MAEGSDRLFLERESYRRRRLADAARLLPIVGFVLLLLPVLLRTTNDALVYIFTVWALLILAIGLVSHRLSRTEAVPTREPDTSDKLDDS